MRYLLGIDLGTSAQNRNIDEDGKLCVHVYQYPMTSRKNGWAEQDPKIGGRLCAAQQGCFEKAASAPRRLCHRPIRPNARLAVS